VPRIESEVLVQTPVAVIFDLAKQVERFPDIMPDVESVKVLERDGSRTVTEWAGKIKEFNRLVRWTEEDEWDDRAHTCRFWLIKGDFDKYEGTWTFEEVPEGTRVHLALEYEYSVPLIGAIIKALVRKLMQQNCDQMLAALKQEAEKGA
jgi:ribosome-associated toxin RatA of RatAB toxin-antitoxin module